MHRSGIVARPGSTANVIAGVCSFFVPGLGQLVQARPFTALIHFALSLVLWIVWLGWLIHIWSAFSAAFYDPYRHEREYA